MGCGMENEKVEAATKVLHNVEIWQQSAENCSEIPERPQGGYL